MKNKNNIILLLIGLILSLMTFFAFWNYEGNIENHIEKKNKNV